MTRRKNPVWYQGSMRFELEWAGPHDAEGPRVWRSKSGEPPATFIARIVRDREAAGANMLDYLMAELKMLEEAR